MADLETESKSMLCVLFAACLQFNGKRKTNMINITASVSSSTNITCWGHV